MAARRTLSRDRVPRVPLPPTAAGQISVWGFLAPSSVAEVQVENLESEKPGFISCACVHTHTHTHTHPPDCKYRIQPIKETMRTGFNEVPRTNGVFRVLLGFYCVHWSF